MVFGLLKKKYTNDDHLRSIIFTFENDRKVVIESSLGGRWTVKILGDEPVIVPNYQEMVESVITLLK